MVVCDRLHLWRLSLLPVRLLWARAKLQRRRVEPVSGTTTPTKLVVTNGAFGSFEYRIYYWEGNYAEGITGEGTVEGPVSHAVYAPTDAYFTIDDVSATEGNALTFTVTKHQSNGSDVYVNFATEDWGGTAGSDYYATSGTLTFTPTDTTQTITVYTIPDPLWEVGEGLLVRLSNATGGSTIYDELGTGSVNQDDAPASFTVHDASSTEGSAVTFTVEKTGQTEHPHVVVYFTTPGTAAMTDYTDIPSWQAVSLTFWPNETSKTVSINTTNNTSYEGDETFYLDLTGYVSWGGVIADGRGVGTIIDNDPAPTFQISNSGTTEGTDLAFLVTKGPQPTDVTINVSYATVAGGSAAADDYTATSGTIIFTQGLMSHTIYVPTTPDSVYENNETVLVNLGVPTPGGTLLNSQGTGTINNDDAAPTFSVSSVMGAEGTVLQFSVTQTGQSQFNHSVSYQTANTTASAPGDYTAVSGTLTSFVPGTPQTVNVNTAEDLFHEGNETFSF